MLDSKLAILEVLEKILEMLDLSKLMVQRMELFELIVDFTLEMLTVTPGRVMQIVPEFLLEVFGLMFEILEYSYVLAYNR
jgi:hypothetical protein